MRYREQRLPCDTPVRIVHGGAQAPARLVNVSPSGARLAGTGALPRNAAVALVYLGLRVDATVAWSTERETGLRFSGSITPADLAALRRAGGGAGGSRGWMGASAGFREMS